jgi:hypothetical protein
LAAIKVNYSLPDLKISRADRLPEIPMSVYMGFGMEVAPGEFLMKVPGVADFYVAEGRLIEYVSHPGADREWVRLYLEGVVLVALLHQRDIISFHASSFVFNGSGVVILGDTGAGKSSLTLSFILGGAGFLTDDLTPVVLTRGKPCVMPLNRRMKIRSSTAAELGVASERLTDAESGTGKKYMEIMPVPSSGHPVDVILKIEVGDVAEPLFEEPAPTEKFSLLRSEVCSWEILAGMPETESAYLQQIVDIVRDVKIFKVTRPAGIRIADFYESVREFLGRGMGGA